MTYAAFSTSLIYCFIYSLKVVIIIDGDMDSLVIDLKWVIQSNFSYLNRFLGMFE